MRRFRSVLHACSQLLAVSLLAVLALSPMYAVGQSESGKAAINGRVTDGSGGVIPGATITLIETQTGIKRVVTTDGAGLYSAPSLLVGTYSVKAESLGFGSSTKTDITLTVGQAAEVDLALKPGSVATSVEVSGENIDMTHRDEVANSTVLGNEAVENLPTRGRNFTDFALLSPGISQELDRFGLIVNGQRSGNSNISIDGVDFNDPLQNGQRGGSEAVYFFPQVAVREFQVVRTGATAEIGRTNAGFVNVTTKSGTNRFHGEGLYMNRNPWLTWPDALNDPEATNNENQYAFGIGGPILRDKLFFYAGVEKTNFQVPFFVRFNSNCPTAGYYDPTGLSPACAQGAPGAGTQALPANIAALEVNSYGLNNPLASSARLDWQINNKNTAMLQYMSTFLSGLAFNASGVQNAVAANNDTYAQQSQGVVVGLTTSLDSRRTNDLHAQFVYDHRQQVPNSAGPEIDIGDLTNLGGNAGGTNLYRAIREEFIDNFSLLAGKHSFKVGVDVNLEPETQQREDNAAGLWTVDTFADYLAVLPVSQGGTATGTPSSLNAANCKPATVSPGQPKLSACPFIYQQTLPIAGQPVAQYRQTQREFAAYMQDMYHVLPYVTLGLGFRYEAEVEPKGQPNLAIPGTGVEPSDVTMFQPRFGVAWDAHHDGSTVVRVSVGMFDARTPGYILQRDFTDNGLHNAEINSTYDPNVVADLTPFTSFGTPIAGLNIVNDIYATNPAFRNPRSFQTAATVEQRLSKTSVLVLGATRQETWKLQHRLDTNLFQPNIDAATLYPIFPSTNPVTGVACSSFTVPYTQTIPCRPNSTINGFHQNLSTAHATYDGLIAQYEARLFNRLTAAANFTWASSRDDDSNERDFSRELALDVFCVACYNKGYSKQDIREQFNLHFVYKLPYRFTISSSFLTRTGLPYTATTSGSKQGDFGNDGNTNNDRPILCSQKAYTVCPVSTQQINSYKGTGAEVGTVVGRNTFRQPGFLNWDMRLQKSFRVYEKQEAQFSAECLNCTRASNLNLGANEVSKFTHSQPTMNPATGYYYSGNNAGKFIDAYDTFRSGGPRQIQLSARYIF